MSTGEVLIKALSDTLMGMGTVFIILLVISFVISLLKLLNKKEKTTASTDEVIKGAAGAVKEEPDIAQEDDGELVAAIIAAVMALKAQEDASLNYEVTADGTVLQPKYVVRSIKRRR